MLAASVAQAIGLHNNRGGGFSLSFALTSYRRYVRAPNHPMKGRILKYIERTLLPANGIRCLTQDDIWMRLRPDRSWENHLLRGGTYQHDLCKFMSYNLRSGDMVAIAGVSFGLQMVVASRAVGPNGCVVGIDPHPAALITTRDNLSLNALPADTMLVAAALGKQNNILPISSAIIDHVGEASLLKVSGNLPYYVSVSTLPEILSNLRVARLDALFLDVIGYEKPILETLAEPYWPRLMIVSVHPWVAQQTGDTLDIFQSKLFGMGYSTFSLDGREPKCIDDLRGCQLVAIRGNSSVTWLAHDPSIPGGVWM